MRARFGFLLFLCPALLASAHGEEQLELDIAPVDRNKAQVTVLSSPGLHRIESSESLAPDSWSGTNRLSSQTNITFQTSAARTFLRAQAAPANDIQNFRAALSLIDEGRATFRHDTFGNESFWTDALKLHLAIAGTNHGGAGPGVSPATALAVGLKVDLDALPQSTRQAIAQGKVDLNAPATTLALLELDAVVGVKGRFNDARELTSIGVQCALCHSTVDDSFAPGIGHRLDGWPNRDLNVGAIINLSPDVAVLTNALQVDEQTVRTVLQSWGPGRFDAALVLDGKAFRPDGKSGATVLPPAFGLAGVNLATYTGWGSVTHWNAFVGNLEMHGNGTFWDPRLNDTNTFPLAAKFGYGNVRTTNDLITPKLAALHFYQLSIPAPTPDPSTFNREAATRGELLFNNKAQCSTCHVPPLYTEPGWNMHTPAEIGIDDFQANRSPDKRYRTTPLRGLFTRAKGGFYHDGRFENLGAVVDHYNGHLDLELTSEETADLVEFLKSL